MGSAHIDSIAFVAKPVILCVDDEKAVLHSLRQELGFSLSDRFSIELAESAEEALELVADITTSGNTIAAVISDHLMPGMKGDAFLGHISRLHPNVGRILLTGQSQYVENTLHQQDGVTFLCLPKPWAVDQLRNAVLQVTAPT